MTQPPLSGAPAVHITVQNGLQDVAAGDSSTFELTVTNLASEPQAQTVSVEGLPSAWVTIDFDATQQAYPQEQRSALVTVTIPVGTESGTVRFRVVATVDGERSSTDCVLQVSGVDDHDDDAVEDDDAVRRPGVALAPAELSVVAGADEPLIARLSVRNVNPREMEYSIELTGLDARWYELPRRIRVPANEALDAELRVRPPAGSPTGVQRFTVRVTASATPEASAEAAGELTVLAPSAAPEEPAAAEPSQVRATEAASTVPPYVSIGPQPEFRFGPGEITDQATIRIENRGRLLEGYDIEIEGLPDDWYRLPIREVRLEPGSAQELSLRLTPKPGAQHPAGEYPFRVRVVPRGAADALAEVGGVLTVVGTEAFDARVAPAQAQGRTEQYKVTLRNTGTEPISLWIEGSDPEGMCRFDYPPPPNLQPGEERVLPVRVGVRRNRFVGRAEAYDFSLRVLPAGGESTSARNFDARLTHQPYLTGRMLRWTIYAAVIVIVVGVILSIGPGRLVDGSDWMRCRFNGSASFCRPTPPRIRVQQAPAHEHRTEQAPVVLLRTSGPNADGWSSPMLIDPGETWWAT